MTERKAVSGDWPCIESRVSGEWPALNQDYSGSRRWFIPTLHVGLILRYV